MQLVILERDPETDMIVHDRATVDVIFRRFAGPTGPNTRSPMASNETDSQTDFTTGVAGVKITKMRRGDNRDAPVFSGKAAFDWLMDCCTTVDKREAFEIANLFIQHDFIEPSGEDRHGSQVANSAHRFVASKHSYYVVTPKGQRTAGWTAMLEESVNGEASAPFRSTPGIVRDSNTNRMAVIVRDPALRLLFREYLRETHCEENLAFYLEVRSFLADYARAKDGSTIPQPDVIRETLASAYSLYNAFLAPGSPCELNIDHSLRNSLAGRMTRSIGEDEEMIVSLDEVAGLFDQAQNSVFKLMASVSFIMYCASIPRFANRFYAGFCAQVLPRAQVCFCVEGTQS